MIKSRSLLLPSMAIATTIVVWATAFPAIKLALGEVQPLPLAAIRYAMAAILAMAWLVWKRPRMPARDLVFCAGCGIIAGAAYSVFLNLGQQTVSAGAASFLIKTESLWMAFFAVLLLKESFKAWAWAGTALCVVGVGVIAAAQGGSIAAFDQGAALVLAAALCSAAGFSLQRGLVIRYGALHVAVVSFLAAALALSPWLPLALEQTSNASATTIAWVIFLGLFPTTVGLVCWTYAIGHFGVARAGNFLYLIAPLATLIAWAIAAEAPRSTTILGGALILAGVILVNTRGVAAYPLSEMRRRGLGRIARRLWLRAP